MDIPEIRIDIREIGIRDIPTWLQEPPQAIPPSVPVTQEVGVPIVNIPGCVEAHESNNKSNKVGVDDENGLVTYCDGQTPSFNPINYNPDEMEFEYEQSEVFGANFESLMRDLDFVPIEYELEETAIFKSPCFICSDDKQKNIYFQYI